MIRTGMLPGENQVLDQHREEVIDLDWQRVGQSFQVYRMAFPKAQREELASHMLGATCQLTWLKKKVMLGNNKS